MVYFTEIIISFTIKKYSLWSAYYQVSTILWHYFWKAFCSYIKNHFYLFSIVSFSQFYFSFFFCSTVSMSEISLQLIPMEGSRVLLLTPLQLHCQRYLTLTAYNWQNTLTHAYNLTHVLIFIFILTESYKPGRIIIIPIFQRRMFEIKQTVKCFQVLSD